MVNGAVLFVLLPFRPFYRAPGQEGTRDLHRSGHDWRAGRNGIDVCYYLCRPAIV